MTVFAYKQCGSVCVCIYKTQHPCDCKQAVLACSFQVKSQVRVVAPKVVSFVSSF